MVCMYGVYGVCVCVVVVCVCVCGWVFAAPRKPSLAGSASDNCVRWVPSRASEFPLLRSCELGPAPSARSPRDPQLPSLASSHQMGPTGAPPLADGSHCSRASWDASQVSAHGPQPECDAPRHTLQDGRCQWAADSSARGPGDPALGGGPCLLAVRGTAGGASQETL